MKYRTTEKAEKNGNGYIITVGYCDLQELLSYESPQAYTAGVYGWNSDVYHFGGVAISTGYRPISGIRAGHDICKKYEKKAAAAKRRCKHYDSTRAALDRLISQFIDEALKETREKEAAELEKRLQRGREVYGAI